MRSWSGSTNPVSVQKSGVPTRHGFPCPIPLPFLGHMDDLAVFNRALTDAEVKEIFVLKNGIRELHP